MVDIIKSIIEMSLFILSTILGSWRFTTQPLPTLWMYGNPELQMAGNMHAAG